MTRQIVEFAVKKSLYGTTSNSCVPRRRLYTVRGGAMGEGASTTSETFQEYKTTANSLVYGGIFGLCLL